MVMSRDQNAGRNHSVRIDNSTFGRVEEFKYLRTSLTIQNSIREEIKCRLRSGNACYHWVQNLLSSRLLSRKLKFNPQATELYPICKSQVSDLFCGVFKFCACFSKNLNISRNKRDKFAKRKTVCGE